MKFNFKEYCEEFATRLAINVEKNVKDPINNEEESKKIYKDLIVEADVENVLNEEQIERLAVWVYEEETYLQRQTMGTNNFSANGVRQVNILKLAARVMGVDLEIDE